MHGYKWPINCTRTRTADVRFAGLGDDSTVTLSLIGAREESAPRRLARTGYSGNARIYNVGKS